MKEKKIRFLTIGYIENRKGQDILLAAVKRLPEDMLRQCEFYLVGNDTSVMACRIKEEIKDIPQVIITGLVDRKTINSLLSSSDMLICPSREDPMPTVAAEAMMHSVPCLLSDAAGTAAYITDEVDGLLFASENEKELSEKICWCIRNSGRLGQMGKKAREIYEQHFSMEVFEKSFLDIVDRIFEGQE